MDDARTAAPAVSDCMMEPGMSYKRSFSISNLSQELFPTGFDLLVTLTLDLKSGKDNHLQPVLSATKWHQLDFSLSIHSKEMAQKCVYVLSVTLIVALKGLKVNHLYLVLSEQNDTSWTSLFPFFLEMDRIHAFALWLPNSNHL